MTIVVVIALIAAIGMTAINMGRTAFAQSEQFSPDTGLLCCRSYMHLY